MSPDDVLERLTFAEKRRGELEGLNKGDLAGADVRERQQLIQEFFFHAVGAIDMLGQLVNEARCLGMNSEDVTVPKVASRLPVGDPLRSKLTEMHPATRQLPLPADPYGPEGYAFRLLNYRHQVTHRGRNPFFFRMGASPRASLVLDPRDPASAGATRSASDELRGMLALVRSTSQQALAFL